VLNTQNRFSHIKPELYFKNISPDKICFNIPEIVLKLFQI
jgi:hypothetical protein